MKKTKICLYALVCVGVISDAGAAETVMFHKYCGNATTTDEQALCANIASVGSSQLYSACSNNYNAYVSPYSEYPYCGAFSIIDYMGEPHSVIMCFASSTPCWEIIYADASSTDCSGLKLRTTFDPYQSSGTTFEINNIGQLSCCANCMGVEEWTEDAENEGVMLGGRTKTCSDDGVCDYWTVKRATCAKGYYSAAGLDVVSSSVYETLECTHCELLGATGATTSGISAVSASECYLPDGTIGSDASGTFEISGGDCVY